MQNAKDKIENTLYLQHISSCMTASPTPVKQYVEQRDQGYWIEGTRISLDSVVYAFLNGDSPENIAQNFPLLSLEQVYGAIAFYLANRELVDAYLKEGEVEFAKLQQSLRENNPLLYQKLQTAQTQKQSQI
ncbi:hypothetical protein Nos7524_4291 [Nostoc sp. PCC 7524]|nr:hypothetical protein Nos7524_4291 [Nostoc sp. PCC 7524]